MGIGLHAGPVMLGTIGSAHRMDTTVIGDTVNTASRLEGLTEPYGAAVVVSGAVRDRLRDPGRFTFREVGRVRAKGKIAPVTVHEVLDARGDEMGALVAALPNFVAGLAAWYSGGLRHLESGLLGRRRRRARRSARGGVPPQDRRPRRHHATRRLGRRRPPRRQVNDRAASDQGGSGIGGTAIQPGSRRLSPNSAGIPPSL